MQQGLIAVRIEDHAGAIVRQGMVETPHFSGAEKYGGGDSKRLCPDLAFGVHFPSSAIEAVKSRCSKAHRNAFDR